MCMPYSPEFLPRKPGQGAAALEGLAKATGGCERVNLPEIWRQVPRKPQNVPLSPFLLLLAAGIFLAEVLQRRTGVLSLDWRSLRRLQGAANWLGRWTAVRLFRRKAAVSGQAGPQGSAGGDAARAASDRPLQVKPDLRRSPLPAAAPPPAAPAKPAPAAAAKPAAAPTDGMGDALEPGAAAAPAAAQSGNS